MRRGEKSTRLQIVKKTVYEVGGKQFTDYAEAIAERRRQASPRAMLIEVLKSADKSSILHLVDNAADHFADAILNRFTVTARKVSHVPLSEAQRDLLGGK
jgi:hypothetical protein